MFGTSTDKFYSNIKDVFKYLQIHTFLLVCNICINEADENNISILSNIVIKFTARKHYRRAKSTNTVPQRAVSSFNITISGDVETNLTRL